MSLDDGIVTAVYCHGFWTVGASMSPCSECEKTMLLSEATDEWLRSYDEGCDDRDNYAFEELARRRDLT